MANELSLYDIFPRMIAALLIGLLIGLQREHDYASRSDESRQNLFAGIRTFALIGLLGCVGGLLTSVSGIPGIYIALIVIGGVLLSISYYFESSRGFPGMTTEVAAVITFITGGLCFYGYTEVAAAIAVIVTVILALKPRTQKLLAKITNEDIYATLKFAVITFIILPVLPAESSLPPPFDVLVPYKIWLMVCLISGISFLGYVLIKLVGSQQGIGLAGLLGGLASSTAVTLTFSQRSKSVQGLEYAFALAILLAWLMMFARVLVEVAVVNQSLLSVIWLPLVVVAAAILIYCYFLQKRQKSNTSNQDPGEFSNPFELGPAIKFGALYGLILVVANVARIKFGDTGVYVSSIVSGLADVDAITLTMAELSQEGGELSQQTAAEAIVLASISNTVVKGGIVLSAASAELRKVIFPGLVIIITAALASLTLI